MRRYGQNKTIYILYVSLWGSIKVYVQNGVSGSYMDAVFKLGRMKSERSGHVYHTALQGSHTTAARQVEVL